MLQNPVGRKSQVMFLAVVRLCNVNKRMIEQPVATNPTRKHEQIPIFCFLETSNLISLGIGSTITMISKTTFRLPYAYAAPTLLMHVPFPVFAYFHALESGRHAKIIAKEQAIALPQSTNAIIQHRLRKI